MAIYLCQTMKRLASEHNKTLASTPDFAYKNAYLVGMAVRLCTRIAEMKAQHKRDAANNTSSNALVLWSENEAIENKAHVEQAMGVKLKTRRTPAKIKYNTEAMGAGKRDAEKVSLSQQVGSSAKTAPHLTH